MQFINSLNGTRLGTFLQAVAFIASVPIFQNNVGHDRFSRSGSILRTLDIEGAHPDDPVNTRCYGVLGCITVKYPAQRGFHLFPEPLQDIKPTVCLYVDAARTTCQPVEADTLDTLNISASPRSFWISHGYIENAQYPWIQLMVNELLNYDQDYNVMVIDWSRGAEPPYAQAVVNLELEAAFIGHLMLNVQETVGLNVSDAHFIGHSLGSHLGGFVGTWLQTYADCKLGRISGLDPAQPFFENYPEDARLDSTDANLVDVIHTDAKPLLHGGSISGLGTQEPSGHVDFFPNNGKDQPGCNDGVYQSILQEDGSLLSGLRRFFGCDHIRSYEYFIESIRSPCRFISFSCSSWTDFISSSCPIVCNNPESDDGSCNQMGFHAKKPSGSALPTNQTWKDGTTNVTKPVVGSIVYYSITGSRVPYCREHYQVTLNLVGISVLRVGHLQLVIFGRKRSVKILNLGERDLRGSLTYKFVVGGPPMDGQIQRAVLKPASSNPIWWFVSRMARIPDIEFDSVSIVSLEKSQETTLCPEGKGHLTMSDRNPHIMLTTTACTTALQRNRYRTAAVVAT